MDYVEWCFQGWENLHGIFNNLTFKMLKSYCLRQVVWSEMEFKEFEPRFKSAKTRFKWSAGLNLETFDTILTGTNHI